MLLVHISHSESSHTKEGNVLFNDALNTFYFRLYGVGHMVKDHSDSERGHPLPPHGLLFPINSKGSLNAPSHRQDSTYNGRCYTSRGSLAGTRNIQPYEAWRYNVCRICRRGVAAVTWFCEYLVSIGLDIATSSEDVKVCPTLHADISPNDHTTTSRTIHPMLTQLAYVSPRLQHTGIRPSA